MAFKYKLAEDKHAGTEGIFSKQLAQWDKEWEEKKSEIAKLPKELQDKIKNAAKKALSEKKCWDGYKAYGKKIKDGKSVNDCRPIKK
jgi:hypothetical protein